MSATASKHRPLTIVLMVLTAVVMAAMFIVNGLAGWDSDDNPIFNNSTGDISDKYHTDITPAGWTFSIWGVIYAWQVTWLVYVFTTICRQGIDGPLYCHPPYIPMAIYPAFIVNNALNVTWLILFDREEMIAGLPVIALTACALYVCLGLSFWGLDRYGTMLSNYGLKREVWFTRFMLQNGLAVYAAWVTIATLLNLSIVLVYETDKDPTDAQWMENVCTICLAILSFELVVWFIADLTVLDRFTRYVFTPHFVVVVALVGILDENYVKGSRNSIMLIAMLGAAGVAAVTKVVVMIWRYIQEARHEGTAKNYA